MSTIQLYFNVILIVNLAYLCHSYNYHTMNGKHFAKKNQNKSFFDIF